MAEAQHPPLTLATIIQRTPSVLTARIDGEVVMMGIEQGGYFGLDEIGGDIWRRIEPALAVGKLCDALAASYAADRAVIECDVLALLDQLLSAGMIEVVA